MKLSLLRVAIAVSVLAPLISVAAQHPEPERSQVSPPTTTAAGGGSAADQRRLDAFDKVWNTINKNYYDATFNGVNWSKTRDEFRPRVIAAKTDKEFHLLLEEMLGRLGKSHLAVIPPDYFKTFTAAKREARLNDPAANKKAANGDDLDLDDDDDDLSSEVRYGTGIELRIIADRAVITRVALSSGALAAGLKPGFVLEKVNGVSVTDLIHSVKTNFTYGPSGARLLPHEIVSWLLDGDKDTSAVLSCLDDKDQMRDFTVQRLALPGQPISLGADLPTQYLDFEERSLNDKTGYIRFNVFAVPVIAKLCSALTDLHNKDAIIVDMRGNYGGVIASIVGLAGMLTDRTLQIGTSTYRTGSERLSARSEPKNYKGKLIILIDDQSMSAAEFFAAALKESGRAVLVGERTAGAALPAVSVKLQTGAVFQYPIANFMTADGYYIEGLGVKPDIAVTLDRASLLRDGDPILTRAIAAAAAAPAAKADASPTGTVELTRMTDTDAPPPPAPVRSSAVTSDKRSRRPPRAISSITAAVPVMTANDPAALSVVDRFRIAMDPSGKLASLRSYVATGSAVTHYRGADSVLKIEAARELPDKFSIIVDSPAVALTHTFAIGHVTRVQSDYGLDEQTVSPWDTSRTELFAPLMLPLDGKTLRGIKFMGKVPDGNKVYDVLSAKTAEGIDVGLSFDSVTHLLASFVMGSEVYNFGDYRGVDGMLFPFHIDLANAMDLHLTSLTVNVPVDPSRFQPKVYCFDEPIK